MKRLCYALILLLILYSCVENKAEEVNVSADATKLDPAVSTFSLDGNWEMIGFYNYRDNKIIDSFKTDANHRQVKMFNKNKVMWSKSIPESDIEWFGYGSYLATDSTLIERMEYGSSVMNQIIEEQGAFNYKLMVGKDTFSQIQIDSLGNKLYSENYKRIN